MPLPLLGLGAVALVTLASSFGRRTLVVIGGKVLTESDKQKFGQAIPAQALPYLDQILRVSDDLGIDPFVIAALGMRESRWGEGLTPRGPTGTGDFTRRPWAASPLPPDGLGWGRGLMQIDYASAQGIDWRDPLTNIRAGGKLLKQNLAFFGGPGKKTVTLNEAQASRRGVAPGVYTDPRPLKDAKLVEAAIAAYNTGMGNVLYNLAVGKSAEFTTAGGNYSSDVLALAQGYSSRLG